MTASRITAFIGLAIGIAIMKQLGYSGILMSGIFGAAGGAIGGLLGALIEHSGKSNNFVDWIDNLLWFILFFIAGSVIGVIITANLSIANNLQTIIDIVSGVIFSICLTARKIKKKRSMKDVVDDSL